MYGVIFLVVTFLAWKKRTKPSLLLSIGISIFWLSYVVQLGGFFLLFYVLPTSSWEVEIVLITSGGMLTGAVMIAHSYARGIIRRKSQPNKQQK